MNLKNMPVFFLLLVSAVFAGENPFQEIQKTVLANNSRIKAMEGEALMLKTQISTSSALEDPKLKLGVNNVPVMNPGFKMDSMTSKEIGISQMIPLGGKLGLRESIAEKKYTAALEKVRKEKAEVLHMARMGLYELSFVRDSIKIMEEIKAQIKILVDSEIAANKSGTGSLTNVIKANIEYNMIDEGLISLHQKETEVTSRIEYLAGKKGVPPLLELPEPELRDVEAESYIREVLAVNPDLRIITLEKDIAGNEMSLKRKDNIPDVEFGISYMQRDKTSVSKGDDMFSAMAVLNIPIWQGSKNRPMIEEMKNKLSMSQNYLSDKKNFLVSGVETIHSRMKKWSSLYSLYKDQIIPQTELSVETSHAGHKAGTREFMSIIDGIRMLLKYKIDMLMAKKEFQSDLSELHMLMGGEILK